MRTWVRAVDAVAVVLGAKLTAGLVLAFVRASMPVEAPPEARALTAPIATPASFERYAAVVKRNVFQHGEPVPGEEPIADEAPVEACDLPLRVVSAAIVAPDDAFSVATIVDQSGPKPRMLALRAGEAVGELGVLRRFWIDEREVAAEIVVGGRVVLCRSDDAPPPAFPRSIGGAKVAMATGAGIKKVADSEYEVAQAEVDAMMSGGLMSEARNVVVVPYFEKGSAAGFKLARVKPASILSKVGLATGDVIRRINGYDITTPEKALQVYGMLKNEKRISVDVTRGGAPKTFTYVIR